jgi:hypothetical protein
MSKRPRMSSARRPQPARTPAGSQACRLASEDLEFLAKDDLRPLRLQLELLKPEWYLRQEDVRSTIGVFRSAQTPEAGQAVVVAPGEAGGRLQ